MVSLELVFSRHDWPLYLAAGMICETGETSETGENAVVGVVFRLCHRRNATQPLPPD
jgi:hypothetical protein